MKLIVKNINSLDDIKTSQVKDKFPKRYELALKQNSEASKKRLILGASMLLNEFNSLKESDITYNDYGKPYIKDAFINLSKSNELVVLVVDNNEVGVDIEYVTNRKVDAIINNLQDDEKDYLNKNPNNFFNIWTAKEAIMKLKGVGLSYSFKKFSTINLITNGNDVIDNNKIYLKAINLNDYIISIASYKPIENLEIIK